MTDRTALHALLGLSDSDQLVERARLPAPTTGVALGFAGVELLSLDETLAAIAQQPGLFEDAALARALNLDNVVRWNSNPQLVILGDAPILSHQGRVAYSDDLGWVLDTRGDQLVAVLRGADGGATYVSGARGELEIGQILLGAESVAPFPFTPLEQVPLPALGELMEQLGVQRWLRDEVDQRAASTLPLTRAAAVGLASRLAVTALERPGELFRRIVSGAPDPIDELRTWARGLSPALLDQLTAAALEDAALLGDELEALPRRLTEDDAAAAALALAMRRDRDDLESVAFVLRAARPDTSLTEALRALDGRASAHLTSFDLVTDPDADPRLLGAVSVAQPAAWWGTAWPG